jgi:hypothetical protein
MESTDNDLFQHILHGYLLDRDNAKFLSGETSRSRILEARAFYS